MSGTRIPARGDAWKNKEDGHCVLVMTVYEHFVLGRLWTDCPLGTCKECRRTTHAGTHLSEQELGHTMKDFVEEYERATSPMWTNITAGAVP